MAEMLRRQGHRVNRKRVRRLMREMGLEVIWRKPNTSKPHPQAPRLSVSVARPGDRPAQSGVGGRHHLHPDAEGDRLLSLVSANYGTLLMFEGATGVCHDGVVYREVWDDGRCCRRMFDRLETYPRSPRLPSRYRRHRR
jgi:transposase InsO family protein